MNIYVDLTNRFNAGRLRAILSSGQAVVLHRLAIMSKDGDWIIREDEEALHYILRILDENGARYRFGAPLDARWLAGGWSSHFEFKKNDLRIRTDFVSRPPRISAQRLALIWTVQENRDLPFVDLTDLADLKKTNREKDYSVIGELSRRMIRSDDQLRYSRSARDIFEIFRKDPKTSRGILAKRGFKVDAIKNYEDIEIMLDAERRKLIHANESRLSNYTTAAKVWSENFKTVEKEVSGLSLLQAHKVVIQKAEGILPFTVQKD
jgi:hypothetical protein